MKVAIGSDHGGFRLKQELMDALGKMGHEIIDVGTKDAEPVDYPDFAIKVAREILSGNAERGIMIDGAGIGSSIAANKLAGIRAAVVTDYYMANNAREHNDANMLCLGAQVIGPGEAIGIAKIFLETPFAGGRHLRRIEKIRALEASTNGIDAELVKDIVRNILSKISGENPVSSTVSQPKERRLRLVTEETVIEASKRGETIYLAPGGIVTALALDRAKQTGVKIVKG